MKILKKGTSSASPKANIDDLQRRLEAFQTELAGIEEAVAFAQGRITAVTNEAEQMTDDIVREKASKILTQGSLYLHAVEDRILKRVLDFMQHAPLWETTLVRNTGVGSGMDHKEMARLYSFGWRFLSNTIDKKSGQYIGAILHRPKVPSSFEEFKAMYKGYHNGSLISEKISTPSGGKKLKLVRKPKTKTKE